MCGKPANWDEEFRWTPWFDETGRTRTPGCWGNGFTVQQMSLEFFLSFFLAGRLAGNRGVSRLYGLLLTRRCHPPSPWFVRRELAVNKLRGIATVGSRPSWRIETQTEEVTAVIDVSVGTFHGTPFPDARTVQTPTTEYPSRAGEDHDRALRSHYTYPFFKPSPPESPFDSLTDLNSTIHECLVCRTRGKNAECTTIYIASPDPHPRDFDFEVYAAALLST